MTKRFKVYKVIGSFQEWSIEDTTTDKVVFGSIMHKYEADRLCEKLNELNDENEQLKEENEFAKLLANHRGEMVCFANSLIQDIDDELTQKMWYQFKEEMYQKWKKKRGIE